MKRSISECSNSNTKKRARLTDLKTIPVSKLRQWKAFKNVDIQFLSSAKLACPAKIEREHGFFVTSNEDVYSVGNNFNGILGIGSEQPSFSEEVVKIDALCKKFVIDFQIGGYITDIPDEEKFAFCAALTKNGDLYTWGKNHKGVLGHGHTNPLYTPTLVKSLNGKHIKQIAFGLNFFLALTEEGQVYSWGANHCGQLGQKSTVEMNPIPQQIEALSTFKVESISAGTYFACALLDDGKLYSWGVNDLGQLGINSKKELINFPKPITPFRFKKIACGDSHTLALSTDGKMYTWGNTYQIQDDGKYILNIKPVEVKFDATVQEIAVLSLECFNVCQTTDGSFYVWGFMSQKDSPESAYKEFFVQRPLKAPFKTMHEVFYHYDLCQEIHAPLTSNTFPLNSALKMEMAFTNQEIEDKFAITFNVEGKQIRAHKAFLEHNNDYFATMFAHDWKETNEGVINVGSDVRYEIFFALLYFLYTEDLCLNETKDLIDMASLADQYLLPDLALQCEQLVKSNISIDNVILVYNKAIGKDLAKLAFEFMVDNWAKVAVSETLSELRHGDLLKLNKTVAQKQLNLLDP